MSKEPIKSVADFLEYIEKIKEEKNYLNNDFIFRGHSKSEYKLEPSIFRIENKGNEAKFWNEIQLRNYDEIEQCKTEFEKLTVMQHYGLPTRLLDWTYNPLVALYFSVEKKIKEDGKIFIVKPKSIMSTQILGVNFLLEIKLLEENKLIEEICINSESVKKLAHHSLLSIVGESKIKEIREKNGLITTEKHLEMMSDIYDYIKGEFNTENEVYKLLRKEYKKITLNASKQHLSSIYFVDPKLTNDRLKAQNGLFSIHGNKIEGDTLIYNELTDKEINEFTDFYEEIIVDKESKAKILKQLEALDIHKGTIYPEIENYSQYLKEKYKNKQEEHHNETRTIGNN